MTKSIAFVANQAGSGAGRLGQEGKRTKGHKETLRSSDCVRVFFFFF